MSLEIFYTLLKKSTFLVCLFFLKNLFGQVADPCNFQLYQLCIADGKAYASTPTNPGATQVLTCMTELTNAYKSCKAGQEAGRNAMALATATAGLTTTSNLSQAQAPTTGVGGEAANGATLYSTCGNTAQTAAKSCTQSFVKLCLQYQQHLASTCPKLSVEAGGTAAQSGKVAEAAGWLKPALVGAGLGLAAGSLLFGKKGGGGGGGDNNPEVKKDEDDNKLKDLVMNSSSSSSAGPNIVYVDKPTPNNNGALGNPAVTDSSTTSRPTDAVTVAAITPSSSFGSDQKSLSTGSDPAPLSRTLSGSTGNTSLGGASGDSMNGSSPESADDGIANGTLVDGSSKGSGGGTGFMGGMDGSGGSGNGQGNSADGTMLTGVLSGVSNDPKKKSLLNKSKNQKTALPAQQQSKASLSASSRRRVANANRQTQPKAPVNLLKSFQERGLLNKNSRTLQK